MNPHLRELITSIASLIRGFASGDTPLWPRLRKISGVATQEATLPSEQNKQTYYTPLNINLLEKMPFAGVFFSILTLIKMARKSKKMYMNGNKLYIHGKHLYDHGNVNQAKMYV